MPFKDKLISGEPLTSLETYQVIQYLINQSRIVNNVTDDNKMKCEGCSAFIRNELYINDYFCSLDIVNTNSFGFDSDFKHYFSIVAFKTEKGAKAFVIDPVFEQFDTDKYPIGEKEYNSREAFKDEEFFNRMKEQKFFELTEDNINNYISGLVNFNNMLGNNLNHGEVIKYFEERIYKNRMNISNKDNLLIDEKEILIQLRQRLVEILKQQVQPGEEDTIKTR